jgi:hypothetical protein
MEVTEKPRTDEYKEISDDLNYDASCTLTYLPVSDLECFQRLKFVTQGVQLFPTPCHHTTYLSMQQRSVVWLMIIFKGNVKT